MKISEIIKHFNYKDKESTNDFQESQRRRKRFNCLVFLAAVTFAISALFAIALDWEKIFDENNLASIYNQSEKYPISVYVIDSGTANCVFIRSEEGNILVDCGQEKADKNVLNLFKILGIDELDLVILTHPDKDHIGNLEEVIENVNVKRFITCKNGDYELTDLYNSLVFELNKKNIDIEAARAGNKISFGELTLDVVSPIMVYDTSNDNSVVVKLCYRKFTALLTGDIGKAVEEDILESGEDISSMVFLVPHHGSGGSTTEEFLKRVNPKYAIISVEQTDYLPSDKTLSRLIKFGCKIYRTDIEGNIVVLSDGEECKVLTEYDNKQE